jgi:RNA polymerase sigma factor (sigma-70 family)
MPTDGHQNPGIGAGRTVETDEVLLEQLRLYLDCRRRHCDPGPLLNAAWEQFYQEKSPHLLRLARAHARPGTDPEDDVQAIWQALLTRLPQPQFDPHRGSIHAWLDMLARHILIDRKRRDQVHTMPHLDTREADQIPGTDPEPALFGEVHQVQELMHRALSVLQSRVSEMNYQILHQHWIEGRSFAAIAQDLGLTPKQVRDRKDRMLRRLRSLLSHHRAEGLFPRR